MGNPIYTGALPRCRPYPLYLRAGPASRPPPRSRAGRAAWRRDGAATGHAARAPQSSRRRGATNNTHPQHTQRATTPRPRSPPPDRAPRARCARGCGPSTRAATCSTRAWWHSPTCAEWEVSGREGRGGCSARQLEPSLSPSAAADRRRRAAAPWCGRGARGTRSRVVTDQGERRASSKPARHPSRRARKHAPPFLTHGPTPVGDH